MKAIPKDTDDQPGHPARAHGSRTMTLGYHYGSERREPSPGLPCSAALGQFGILCAFPKISCTAFDIFIGRLAPGFGTHCCCCVDHSDMLQKFLLTAQRQRLLMALW